MKKFFSVLLALAILSSVAGCTFQSEESELVFSNLGDVTVVETEKPVTVTDEDGKAVTDEEGGVITSIPEKVTTDEGDSTEDSRNTPAVTTAPKSSQDEKVTNAPSQGTVSATTTTKITTPIFTSTSDNNAQQVPAGATQITLGNSIQINGGGASADGSHVYIDKGGRYSISGTLKNGQVEVNTKDKVHLYFNGINVKNNDGPAILITDAKCLTLILMDGTTNYIEDGGADTENNGAFSTNDTLEIKGEGALYIKGNNREGITSDDDIIIESGSLYIQAVDDGLNAKDDITINGGYIYMVCGGDGIDSKGTTNITGGTIIVAGTGSDESAVESDSSFRMTGGILIGVGGTGTIKSPLASSAQHTVLFRYQSVKPAGTLLRLASGNQSLATFAPVSDYSSLTISMPSIKSGLECTLFSGGSCSGTHVNGLYSGGTYTGGEDLGTFTVSSKVSGFNVK